MREMRGIGAMNEEIKDLGVIDKKYFEEKMLDNLKLEDEEEVIENFSAITISRVYDLILTCEYFYFFLKKGTKELVAFSAKSKGGRVFVSVTVSKKEKNKSFIALNNASSKVEGSNLDVIREIAKDIYERYLAYTQAEESRENFWDKFFKWTLGKPLPSIVEPIYSGDELADEFIFGRKVIKIMEWEV